MLVCVGRYLGRVRGDAGRRGEDSGREMRRAARCWRGSCGTRGGGEGGGSSWVTGSHPPSASTTGGGAWCSSSGASSAAIAKFPPAESLRLGHAEVRDGGRSLAVSSPRTYAGCKDSEYGGVQRRVQRSACHLGRSLDGGNACSASRAGSPTTASGEARKPRSCLCSRSARYASATLSIGPGYGTCSRPAV